MAGTWSTNADEVVEAFDSVWLWRGVAAERTATGVRVLIPYEGVIVDADPEADGSWRARVYRVSRPAMYLSAQDNAPDLDLFALSVRVWALEPHEPAWTLLVPAQPSREATRGSRPVPGQDVAFALVDAGEGNIDDEDQEWEDAWNDLTA